MGPRRRRTQRDGPVPDIVRIGTTFAERRIGLRLTQQTLADMAGVSRSSIQSLERGTGSIKFASVVDIAEVLGLHLSFVPEMQ